LTAFFAWADFELNLVALTQIVELDFGRQLGAMEEDFLAAVKLDPTNADANLRLGMVLVSMHKADLGKRYLQRAVDLDPAGDTGAKARLLIENLALKTP